MDKFLNSFRSFLYQNRFLILVLLGFGALFCLISLVNHYNFRTYGFDLGNKNLEMYDYAHFRWNKTTIRPVISGNKLADHFSLTPMLFAPFIYLFGSYTALIFQILFILLGGVGIHQLILKKSKGNKYLALWATLYFFSLWGIYSALSYDYHDNVVAAMIVPWFFLFVMEQKWKRAILAYSFIIIAKENMALWMGFICLGSLLVFRQKENRKPLILLSGISFIYFIIVVKFIMPSIEGAGIGYEHFHYDALGETMGEAFLTVIQRPQYVFSLLFENHLHQEVSSGIKAELHYVVLISGGIALFFRPQFLVMLIPIYAQKMFNDSFIKWGILNQYSIEFAPILTICLFFWITEQAGPKKKIFSWVPVICTLIAFFTTLSTMDSCVSKWRATERIRFYTKNHYTRNYDIEKVYAALEKIPKDAKVSAHTMLCPHLAMRNDLYKLPVIEDAEYIALVIAEKNHNPYVPQTYSEAIQGYKESGWSAIVENDVVVVLKK